MFDARTKMLASNATNLQALPNRGPAAGREVEQLLLQVFPCPGECLKFWSRKGSGQESKLAGWNLLSRGSLSCASMLDR